MKLYIIKMCIYFNFLVVANHSNGHICNVFAFLVALDYFSLLFSLFLLRSLRPGIPSILFQMDTRAIIIKDLSYKKKNANINFIYIINEYSTILVLSIDGTDKLKGVSDFAA
jgi:hypothetical protein